MEHNISYKKDTTKVMLLQVPERLDANYCQFQDWKNFVHVSIMHQAYLRIISCAHLKMEKLILGPPFGSWNLKIGITRCTLFHCCACMHQKPEKSIQESCASKFRIISAFKLPSCELVGFYWYKYVYTYRRQEILYILEKNYGITLDSFHLFTKKCWTWNWTGYS